MVQRYQMVWIVDYTVHAHDFFVVVVVVVFAVVVAFVVTGCHDAESASPLVTVLTPCYS